MERLSKEKQLFINSWGSSGITWGINKTMAQIHALLLCHDNPLSTDQIMEMLNISRGNVNMNVRTLIDWALVKKEFLKGERKEFFVAEKDMFKVSRVIINERRKRELYPILETLREIKAKDISKEDKDFKNLVDELHTFCTSVDRLSDKYLKSENTWMQKVLMKLV